MTKDEDYDALSQKYLASIKRDTRVSLGDATVRATHKVMAEFEALAQPEQEPNGYVQTVIEALYENGDPVSVDAAELLQRITAQPKQESTADMMMGLADRLGELPDDVEPRAWEHLLVYAPKRKWVGLTGGDMDDITARRWIRLMQCYSLKPN